MYLKRVGAANDKSPASLKRLPAMGVQLRDETRDPEEELNTKDQDRGSSPRELPLLQSLTSVVGVHT